MRLGNGDAANNVPGDLDLQEWRRDMRSYSPTLCFDAILAGAWVNVDL